MTLLVERIPPTRDADSLFDAFVDAITVAPYPAQTEALMELAIGSNVILSTPTGSGKSLVALGAHFFALATGRRAFYTAPIKALVSEKFFALIDSFGAERVGMMTGDQAVIMPTR
jgi:superfamily II RNA helicase